MLNHEEVKQYVRNGGESCPYCNAGSLTIVGSFEEADETTVFRQVKCDCCQKSWTDEFTLSGITEHED